VLLLLPPSEGKAPGGGRRPLDLSALSFPSLTPVRERLVEALTTAAVRDPAGLAKALGLGPTQDRELALDAVLRTGPTLPALSRYTGVLYDALDAGSLPARSRRPLVVASALFGLLRAGDRVPAYRLSGATVLPGVGGLAPLWRPALEPLLAGERGLVVDLRSGAYAALGRAPGAVAVRVLRESGGVRTVISHDNKHTKGLLARTLCEHPVRSASGVAEAGRSVADDVEVDGRRVDLVLYGLASARDHA
jgi:uncharacterized protein